MFYTKEWSRGAWSVELTFDLARLFSLGVTTILRDNWRFTVVEISSFSITVTWMGD
jgi:hypothetical protein